MLGIGLKFSAEYNMRNLSYIENKFFLFESNCSSSSGSSSSSSSSSSSGDGDSSSSSSSSGSSSSCSSSSGFYNISLSSYLQNISNADNYLKQTYIY